MTRKSAIALFTEHYNATHYINFVAPFVFGHDQPQLLARSAGEVNAISNDLMIEELRREIKDHGVIAAVFSRFVTPGAETIISFYQSHSIPTYFHLDDWLFGLPDDLGEPYRSRYGVQYGEQLEAILNQVDVVLCSSRHLSTLIERRIPGKIVRTLTGVCYQSQPSGQASLKARASRAKRKLTQWGQITIGYAGSSSHARDMQLVLPAIERLLEERSNLRFQTFGIPMPDALQQRWGPRVSSIGYTRDYPAYLQALYELGWDIGLSPLIDDEFNRCKTATKLIEYTSCGIASLCSDVEPYRTALGKHNTEQLITPTGWYDALQHWIDHPTTRQTALRNARLGAENRGAYVAGQTLIKALEPQARS
ncbi:hypothetical protein OPU71_12095 [Niveibacterium sp. 24ML]|uniref:hypothetical protein n=1 Tax=Niveibacterium sp. 24ML TaxID=2985512 RepID=UPI00226F34A9|nr:hypothetical protein [Niveibacterium sp. 24ML]MCX9156866.1 hypothetical protein [Niveibacterium sp. 24ML]